MLSNSYIGISAKNKKMLCLCPKPQLKLKQNWGHRRAILYVFIFFPTQVFAIFNYIRCVYCKWNYIIIITTFYRVVMHIKWQLVKLTKMQFIHIYINVYTRQLQYLNFRRVEKLISSRIILIFYKWKHLFVWSIIIFEEKISHILHNIIFHSHT